jgi:hypothetical protein
MTLDSVISKYKATIISNETPLILRCRFEHVFSATHEILLKSVQVCPECKKGKTARLAQIALELEQKNIPIRPMSATRYWNVRLQCEKQHMFLSDIDDIPNYCPLCIVGDAGPAEPVNLAHDVFQKNRHNANGSIKSDPLESLELKLKTRHGDLFMFHMTHREQQSYMHASGVDTRPDYERFEAKMISKYGDDYLELMTPVEHSEHESYLDAVADKNVDVVWEDDYGSNDEWEDEYTPVSSRFNLNNSDVYIDPIPIVPDLQVTAILASGVDDVAEAFMGLGIVDRTNNL